MEKSRYDPSDTPFFRSLVVRIQLKSPPATFFLEPFPASITLPADHTGPEAMQIVIWVDPKLDLAIYVTAVFHQANFISFWVPIYAQFYAYPCAIWAAHAASCPTSASRGRGQPWKHGVLMTAIGYNNSLHVHEYRPTSSTC